MTPRKWTIAWGSSIEGPGLEWNEKVSVIEDIGQQIQAAPSTKSVPDDRVRYAREQLMYFRQHLQQSQGGAIPVLKNEINWLSELIKKLS